MKKTLATVIVFCIVATSAIALTTARLNYSSPEFHLPWDHHKYIFMATQPLGEYRIAPFSWRIGVPLLAQVLPFDLETNFYYIAFVSIFATGIVLFYTIKSFGFHGPYAFAGLWIYYSLYFATGWMLYDFWLPDAASFFFICLAIYLASKDRLIAFALVISVGVMIKESVIFVAPLFYSLHMSKIVDWHRMRKTALASFPAAAILVLLRILIPQGNGDPAYMATLPSNISSGWGIDGPYSLFALAHTIIPARIANLSVAHVWGIFTATFGYIALLAFIPVKKHSLHIKFAPFIALICAQLIFAVNTERLLVAGFPAVIILTLQRIRSISDLTNKVLSRSVLIEGLSRYRANQT